MATRHVTKQLSAYCNGELPVEESRRLREHLLECRQCRQAYEEIRLGVELARHLTVIPAPDSLWNDLESQLAPEQTNFAAGRSGTRRFGWYQVASAAAALLMIGVVATWYYSSRLRPSIHEGRSVAVNPPEPNPPSTSPPSIPVPGPKPAPGGREPGGPRSTPHHVAWEVNAIEGQPKVGSEYVKDKARLAVGEWLETDARSRAQIAVADIGQVEVDQNSRVKLVRTRASEHRLALAKGKLSAKILAPPRLFFVDTPSAVAVDYGCAYTLRVDDDGGSTLRVETGWVMLVSHGRESMVPAGGVCLTRRGIGPGTPYFEDASETFLNALERFDFEDGGDEALNILLHEPRKRDTLTLVNLLHRVGKARRLRVYQKLAEISPPPQGVTMEGVLRLDQDMLERWMKDLTWIW